MSSDLGAQGFVQSHLKNLQEQKLHNLFKCLTALLVKKVLLYSVGFSLYPVAFQRWVWEGLYLEIKVIYTFCTAKGSLCSLSRYFSKLKKVLKNTWAILHLFRSRRVTLPAEKPTVLCWVLSETLDLFLASLIKVLITTSVCYNITKFLPKTVKDFNIIQ